MIVVVAAIRGRGTLHAKRHVNARAQAAHDDPRFSVRIREGLPRMAPNATGKR